MLDLGPRARVVFAVVYLSVQATLIASAGARPDHAFGFRMFSESSTMKLSLSREIDAPSGHGTVTVPAPGGSWSAKDREGTSHRFAWRDRVHEPQLSTMDTSISASYGATAQLARLRAALEDVAAHISDDAETRSLVLDVTVKRNGREPTVVELTSAAR